MIFDLVDLRQLGSLGVAAVALRIAGARSRTPS